MSCENSYLWVQNKNYDGKTIVLKNDESVSSSEVIEKFKSYYFEKGTILNEIKGFKLTLYRKLIGGTSALVLDGHLLEKDHEGRFVPFSYLIECDNQDQMIIACKDSFSEKMERSLSLVQKQVDDEKIRDLFRDVVLKKNMKKFLAWGVIAGAVVGTAIKYKTAKKKRKLNSIGLIIVVIMIAIAAMMKMTTSD